MTSTIKYKPTLSVTQHIVWCFTPYHSLGFQPKRTDYTAQILLQVGTTYEVDEQLTAEEMDILSGVYKVYTGM